MIKVQNLTKRYGSTTAIKDLNFEIQKGEIVGLLGPNGAGKTTTLKILTCFLPPNEGQVSIDNLNIETDSLEIRKKIGYLPELNPLYQEMTVKEYLSFVASLFSIEKADINNKVFKAVETCALKDKLNQEISTLSKGYKQRVGLAQALVHDPELLILDEPTEGLDPNQRIEIRELIKKIGQEKTIVLSSHILSEVEATCNRVFIINKGQIVASGTPEELKKQASTQVKIFLVIEGPHDSVVERIKSLEGVERVINSRQVENTVELELETESHLDLRKKLVHFVLNNSWELLEIHQESKSLEDIFVKLTH